MKKEKTYLAKYYLNEGKEVVEGVFTLTSWRKHIKKLNEMRDKEDKLTDNDFNFTEIYVSV